MKSFEKIFYCFIYIWQFVLIKLFYIFKNNENIQMLNLIGSNYIIVIFLLILEKCLLYKKLRWFGKSIYLFFKCLSKKNRVDMINNKQKKDNFMFELLYL